MTRLEFLFAWCLGAAGAALAVAGMSWEIVAPVYTAFAAQMRGAIVGTFLHYKLIADIALAEWRERLVEWNERS